MAVSKREERSFVGRVVAREKPATIFVSLYVIFLILISLLPFALLSVPGNLWTSEKSQGSCENVPRHKFSTSSCHEFFSRRPTEAVSVFLAKCGSFKEAEIELLLVRNKLCEAARFLNKTECFHVLLDILCAFTYRNCSSFQIGFTSQLTFDACQASRHDCSEIWEQGGTFWKLTEEYSCLQFPQCAAFPNCSDSEVKTCSNEIKPEPKKIPSNCTMNYEDNFMNALSCMGNDWATKTEQVLVSTARDFSMGFCLLCVVIVAITWAGNSALLFPLNGIPMMMLSYLIIMLSTLLPLLEGHPKSFCKHPKNAIDNSKDPPITCRIVGALTHFGVLSISYWCLYSLWDVSVIVSSFSAKRTTCFSRQKLKTFVALLLGILLPGLPVAVLFSIGDHRGYTTWNSHVLTCIPVTKKATLYAMIFPASFSVIIGCILATSIVGKLRNNPSLAEYVRSGRDNSGVIADAYEALEKRFLLQLLMYPLCLSANTATLAVFLQKTMSREVLAHEYKLYLACLEQHRGDTACVFKLGRLFAFLEVFNIFLFDLLGFALLVHILSSEQAKQFWQSILCRAKAWLRKKWKSDSINSAETEPFLRQT